MSGNSGSLTHGLWHFTTSRERFQGQCTTFQINILSCQNLNSISHSNENIFDVQSGSQLMHSNSGKWLYEELRRCASKSTHYAFSFGMKLARDMPATCNFMQKVKLKLKHMPQNIFPAAPRAWLSIYFGQLVCGCRLLGETFLSSVEPKLNISLRKTSQGAWLEGVGERER